MFKFKMISDIEIWSEPKDDFSLFKEIIHRKDQYQSHKVKFLYLIQSMFWYWMALIGSIFKRNVDLFFF